MVKKSSVVPLFGPSDALTPSAPLNAAAQARWNALCPQFAEAADSNPFIVDMLTVYVCSYALWMKAEKELAEYGLTVETGEGGQKTNPAHSVARDARSELRRLAQLLGIDERVQKPIDAKEAKARLLLDKSRPKRQLDF